MNEFLAEFIANLPKEGRTGEGFTSAIFPIAVAIRRSNYSARSTECTIVYVLCTVHACMRDGNNW